ncbi:MAG: hypothetical protein AABY94_10750, partial [Nitrospirota bacterium]
LRQILGLGSIPDHPVREIHDARGMPIDQPAEGLLILLETARHQLGVVRPFSLILWHHPLHSPDLTATGLSALAYLIH